jgi:hypothetical protein
MSERTRSPLVARAWCGRLFALGADPRSANPRYSSEAQDVTVTKDILFGALPRLYWVTYNILGMSKTQLDDVEDKSETATQCIATWLYVNRSTRYL